MKRHGKNNPKEFNASSLREIDSLIKKFHTRFQVVIAPVMGTKSNTLKYHRQSHIVDCIRRLGHLSEYSAQFYEASNMQQKTSYHTTNRKTTDGQYLHAMVEHQRIREAMNSVSTVNTDLTVVKSRNTAYLKASESGLHCIAAKTLYMLPTDGSAPQSPDALRYIEKIGDWEQIKAAVRDAHNGSTPVVNTRSTACLSAIVPWLADEYELHTIRASPSFHKKPYFDSVVYRKAKGTVDYYGQLRMIFTVKDEVSRMMKSLVCVRLYTSVSRSDCLTNAGCESLVLSADYKVMALENLRRRVYIVPDFKALDEGNKNAFHTCKWKWNRSPALQ
jgi:hypothetical protein